MHTKFAVEMKKFGGEATAGVFDYGGFITWIWAHDDMSGALYTGKKTPGPLAVGGRLSTGHLSFVRSMRQRLPRAALDAQTAAWYSRTGTAAPVGAPTAVDILASFPPVRGLVFGSTACGGPERSASSLLRLRRRQPSVSGARLAPAPCSTPCPS